MADIPELTDDEWVRLRLQSSVHLTELRDTESTLQVIVRHTRGLMRADMAYVSFTDFDSNETYIRKSDGVRTEAYGHLRQPLGSGVLGRVAIGHASYWTSDYNADDNLHHVDEIDEIVAREGVRALLGAPLTVAGRVIGALLIAYRSPREFGSTEVARLESIAEQAAIALDNAMRLEQATAVAERTGGAQRRSAEELAILTRGIDLDRRLVEGVTSGSPAPDLVTIAANVLGCDLWFLDLPMRRCLGASTDADAPDTTQVTYMTVTAAGQEFGRLLASRSLNNTEQSMMERVGLYLALWSMLSSARESVELRDGAEAVSSLLEGKLTASAMWSVLAEWSLNQRDRWCVVVLDPPDPVAGRVIRGLVTSAASPMIAAHHDDRICVLTGDANWVEHLPSHFHQRGWNLRGGLSWVHGDPAGIPDGYRKARLAGSAQQTLGRTGLSDGSGLGVLAAVLHLAGEGGLPTSFIADIEPLVNHDDNHRTSLLATASCYFESDGNVARTATLLGVHRNTVRQRLERIGALMGPDWNEMPRKLDLQLALRAHALTEP